MRRTMVVTLLLLAACGRSPSSPTSADSPPAVPAATFTGLWTITYRLTGCTGERYCSLFIGTTRTFDLRLRQSGSRVEGLFVTPGDSAADVAGEVLGDGSVVLSGSAPPASIKDGSMRVTRLLLRPAPGGGLEGSVAYETQPRPQWADFVLPTTAAGDITSATRFDLSMFAAAVDGTWSGRFVVRSCTPVPAGRSCYPHEEHEPVHFELTLTRAGDSLTGTFVAGGDRVPVTGRISGTALALEGETLLPSSGGSSSVRLSGWTGSHDGLGRMTGTFQYEFAYPSDAPRIGESMAAELSQVIKRP